MKMMEIKIITINHSEELSDLLNSEEIGYTKYFNPFKFDYSTIISILQNSINDKFFGIFIENKLIGFYMLRGLDQGYTVPSYGVFISNRFSGLGLAKLTLQHALSICKMNNINEMMLKVHPNNIYAKKMYEDFGFNYAGIDEKNNNRIYKIKIAKKISS